MVEYLMKVGCREDGSGVEMEEGMGEMEERMGRLDLQVSE